MDDNTQRFSGRADEYDRFRQRYPTAAVLSRLRAWCGLTAEWLVADIGAGTGMLAEVFLENGNRVVAVEPNADMRSACERMRGRWPQLDVVDATAEATGLPADSIEMVAAGRAFHWFDTERALAEFRRIAKPGGWLALVSLGRDHEPGAADLRAQAAEFERLLLEHGTDYAYVRSGYRVHEKLRELFPEDAEFQQESIAGSEELDWVGFRGQMMSLSIVPPEGHPKYEGFQRALRSYFDRYAASGIISVPTNCWVTVARLKPLSTR